MKRKDLATIILVVGMSALFAAIISNALFSSSKTGKQEAEKVTDISAKFVRPDSAYFNENSINPTQIIRIGGGGNNTPFGPGQ